MSEYIYVATIGFERKVETKKLTGVKKPKTFRIDNGQGHSATIIRLDEMRGSYDFYGFTEREALLSLKESWIYKVKSRERSLSGAMSAVVKIEKVLEVLEVLEQLGK